MQFSVALKRFLPDFESRLRLRRAINLPRDTFDLLTRRRDPLIPPRGLWYVGGEENYAAINEEFLRYFVDLGKLQPNQRVLDVGCGIGVVAARLTKFLNGHGSDTPGSYDGFDIVKKGIDWATGNITRRHPNFHFTHADVFNKHYNPKGRLDPQSFPFPYEAGSFDFAFLKSVFTHMLPQGVQHYLREVRRVLKPGGRCLATAFLLNPESIGLVQSGKSSLPLTHSMGDYSVVDPKFPETTIGFAEPSFLGWVQAAGLQLEPQLEPSIHYGSWCGREKFLSYQDICILTPA
jgi:SAM-dependent methyltransferase